ncbi:tetratricopeptide repeat protein [Luteolibacter flavescens]|uniref:Tetratricopeptide repeat protein n=1 Tax=Luteolibacter flavescens TaxID=1859460 RepID=A0ABT3FVM0_9BACT|nr:tetratricopeptide repeat protein [Luteolibacter flavescens]MCW1887628.1 tetratricopeptide repeat protein [Luteolibacter flavescens]
MRCLSSLIAVPLVLGAVSCRKESSTQPGPPVATPETAATETTTADEEVNDKSANIHEEVAAAAKDGDREKLLRLWSTGALVDELVSRGYLGEPDAEAKSRAKAAIDEHSDLLASYLEKRIGESWQPYMTSVTTSGLQVSIYRTRQEDGSRDTVMRFWYRSHEGRTQLVDCEDMTLGYRASTLLLGLVAPAELSWRQPLLDLMAKISQAGSESTFVVAAAVGDEADALIAANPPDELKAFAYKLKAERLLMEGKPADALKAIKEFAAASPGSPWAEFLRGMALMYLHREFEAITAFNSYGKLAGWDATAHDYIAWCHYMEGNEKSAIEHAKQGLLLNKDMTGCLLTMVCSSKPAEIAQLGSYFKNTFDSEQTYAYVLDETMDMDDPGVPKAVFSLMETELPKSGLLEDYRKKVQAID